MTQFSINLCIQKTQIIRFVFTPPVGLKTFSLPMPALLNAKPILLGSAEKKVCVSLCESAANYANRLP